MNMQQRPNQMANEQFYMDTMPIRTMPNKNTYGEGVQGVTNNQGVQGVTNNQGVQGVTNNQGVQGVTNNQGVHGAQTAQPKKQQVMPMQMNQMPSNNTGLMPYQENNQGVRGDYYMDKSQGVQGVETKNSQTMPMQNQTLQDLPLTQGVRGDFYSSMDFEQGPPPVMNREYIAGYLRTLIGKNVRAEFAISTGLYLDKAGVVREVGVNYFVLEDIITRARIMCDLYSVRFVTTL